MGNNAGIIDCSHDETINKRVLMLTVSYLDVNISSHIISRKFSK